MPTSAQLAARRAYAPYTVTKRGKEVKRPKRCGIVWMFIVGIAGWRDGKDGDNR